MSRRLSILFGIALGLIAACGGSAAPGNPVPVSVRPGEAAERDTTTVLVQLDSRVFDDMSVYVVHGSERIRLGVATGHSVTTLRIPPHLVSAGPTSVRFAADQIGGAHAILTEAILVERGDIVSLLIPN